MCLVSIVCWRVSGRKRTHCKEKMNKQRRSVDTFEPSRFVRLCVKYIIRNWFLFTVLKWCVYCVYGPVLHLWMLWEMFTWRGENQLNWRGKGYSKTKAAWNGKKGKCDEKGMSFWKRAVAWNTMNRVRLIWTDPNSGTEFDSNCIVLVILSTVFKQAVT